MKKFRTLRKNLNLTKQIKILDSESTSASSTSARDGTRDNARTREVEIIGKVFKSLLPLSAHNFLSSCSR